MSNTSHSGEGQPQAHESAPEQKPIAPRTALAGVAVVLAVFAILAAVGILHRHADQRALAATTAQLAAPTVIVAPPQPGAPVESFTLPGNVTAWTDAPIYARTAGYLTHWYSDIGAHVKKGALLAVIASPEVDQQLVQAQADLATAEATAANARIQAARYTALVQSHAVSRQDTDIFVSQAAAAEAAVKSAQANVRRLGELQSFEKIYAPFDGVVTAREVDTGQLIDPGAGKELFHMQAIQTLRVYVNLPQINTANVRRGARVGLTFAEYPGKIFAGTLVRTADAIDPASRTLLVEIDVGNRDGQLLPGSLAQAHFKTPPAAPALIVPSAALIFRNQGLRVATVVDGNVAHLVPVTIGEDDGATVQIVTGLSADDKVIQDPPDSLIEGEKVSVVKTAGAGGQE